MTPKAANSCFVNLVFFSSATASFATPGSCASSSLPRDGGDGPILLASGIGFLITIGIGFWISNSDF